MALSNDGMVARQDNRRGLTQQAVVNHQRLLADEIRVKVADDQVVIRGHAAKLEEHQAIGGSRVSK